MMIMMDDNDDEDDNEKLKLRSNVHIITVHGQR